MRSKLGVLALGALLTAAPAAKAHELACEKKVEVEPLINGGPGPASTPTNGGGSNYAEIDTYPSRVTWTLKVLNVHDTSASKVLAAKDPLLEELDFSFYPQPPFYIPYMGIETDQFEYEIGSYEHCLEVSGKDGSPDEFIDNVFTVKWDDDNASCSARIKCVPPENGNGEPTGPVTRSMGFWSTHPDAVQACLDALPSGIDLGILTVDSLADAMGIFWGNPAFFHPGPPQGQMRDEYERRQFLLLRQLLAAMCNDRLFPVTSGLIDPAREALLGDDCEQMEELQNLLDTVFNIEQGALPPALEGPADPQTAQSVAVDPTVPSAGSCAN